MTCREKITKDHPTKVHDQYAGGCKGCPADYGYISDYTCVHNDKGKVDCHACWDREAEVPYQPEKTYNVDIHKLIDDAMEKKDRSVSLYISEHGVSVTVTPLDEPTKWEETGNSNYPIQCSNCGVSQKYATSYCPECGEQMHGLKKEDKDA